MIGWLAPAALAGLGLVALPVLVHLLRTHRARRIPFPTLRFITPSRTSAVKLRPPSDLPLMFVRVAIVAAAAFAMAQPLLVTAARVRLWNGRLVRAVVVDTGPGMRSADGQGSMPGDLARPLVEAEIAGAMHAARIDTPLLADGLVRAAAWLAAAPPARREIVVFSTFAPGSLNETAMAQIPANIGVRLVQVGEPVTDRHFVAAAPLAARAGAQAEDEVTLTGGRTAVTRRSVSTETGGLRILGLASEAPETQRIWRTVATAGAAAPAADQPIAAVFGDVPDGTPVTAFGTDAPHWMLQTLIRLQQDVALHRAAMATTASRQSVNAVWTTVATDRDGAPIVRMARSGNELLVQTAAAADSLFAATVVQATLDARAGAPARPDQEILRMPSTTLSAWSRPAPEIDQSAWRSSDRSDARWLWAVALLLLGVETWMRRSKQVAAQEVRDAA